MAKANREKMNKMKKPFLHPYQMEAVNKMKNGCILNGGVGSGKSRTALYYYFKEQGGSINPDYIPMKNPKDLYIITTARKRDTLEWEGELANFCMYTNEEGNMYSNKIIVDSWNNIKKYRKVYDAFFIFDEQRVVGSGAWVKAFLDISRKNDWILLSATPGDTWKDYIPVFIANGFYRTKTEFEREHVVYNHRVKFPKIDRYLGVGKLIRLRNQILINMDFERKTTAHHEDVYAKYDAEKYKAATKNRWDPFKDEPIRDAGGLCYVWRRIVNEDESRQVVLLELFEKHPKMIIFYNFNYELDILKEVFGGLKGVEVAEWNGHKHQPIPESKSWVYLVQYTAGAEGWNCITTDTIVFFSQNYSYKIMQQAAGRIDRLNTPFTDLYYYHLKSRSGIDLAISRALHEKRNFNESQYVNGKENRNTSMNKNQIEELINRRRRQILVHSVIYYQMNDSIIDDSTWNKWAKELEELQRKYPKISEECVFNEAFKDFDSSTGYNLPLDNEWAVRKATELLEQKKKGEMPI